MKYTKWRNIGRGQWETTSSSGWGEYVVTRGGDGFWYAAATKFLGHPDIIGRARTSKAAKEIVESQVAGFVEYAKSYRERNK